MTPLLDIIIQGGISPVMGGQYVKSEENKKMMYIGAKIFMDIQCLIYYLMMKLNLMRMLP